jgi:hypothetical protein
MFLKILKFKYKFVLNKMEYIIDLTNTITSYIYSFFVQEEYLLFKKIEMSFEDDINEKDVENLINSVKKDIEDEKKMRELQIRYENLVKDYDEILAKKSFDEDDENVNNNDNNNNNEGKILILA